MLHPKDFEVNEAWIAFHLNTAPIRTEDEGDFNCVALMDAASCLILGSELIPVTTSRPIQLEFRHLVESARRHKQRLPERLFLPQGEFSDELIREASEQGINVESVSENELLVFTLEARQGFAEYVEKAPQ